MGLDVDDLSFHGCVIAEGQTQGTEFRCKPSIGALVKKLKSFQKDPSQLKLCYEATYLGYWLQRDLSRQGFDCEIIAPTSIPRTPGSRIKTDRIDANRLAIFYQKGLLQPIYIPGLQQECVRDFIRSRRFLKEQGKALKLHLLMHCRRLGIDYKQERKTSKFSYWTRPHWDWLKREIAQLSNEVAKINLTLLIGQLSSLQAQVRIYESPIAQVAGQPDYQDKVYALTCFRGLDVLSAMTLITEIGDIHRFSHPRRLTSYAGMDLREYSSGGKQRRYGISKMGNRYIRTVLVEASQSVLKAPVVSKHLKQRRQAAPPQVVEISDRCMKRLYKKAIHLFHAGKARNKIKMACAREMLAFVWEALRTV